MPIVRQHTTIRTTTKHSFSGREIISALFPNKKLKKLETVRVVFMVPGGGDWSNTEVAITEKDPITIIFETFECVEDEILEGEKGE